VTQAILYQDGGERKVPRNDAPAPKQ